MYLFILFKDQSDIKRLIVNDIYYNIKLYALFLYLKSLPCYQNAIKVQKYNFMINRSKVMHDRYVLFMLFKFSILIFR